MDNDDTKGPAPSLASLGISKDEIAKMVRREAKRKQKMIRDDVKYAKEDLARAVFRLHEAQEKANKNC